MAMRNTTVRMTPDAYQLELLVYFFMCAKARKEGTHFPWPPINFESWSQLLLTDEDVSGFNNWVTFIDQVFVVKYEDGEREDIQRAFNLLSALFNKASPDDRISSDVFLEAIQGALTHHTNIHFAIRDVGSKGAAVVGCDDRRRISWEGNQLTSRGPFALDVTMSSASSQHVSKVMHAMSGRLQDVANRSEMTITVPDMIEGDPASCVMCRVDNGVEHHYVRFRLQPNKVVTSGE